MNLLLRFIVVSSLLTAAHVFGAAPFEGKVTLTMTSKSKPQNLDYSIKGQKLRIDINVSDTDASEESETTAPKKHDRKSKKKSSSKSQTISTIMDTGKMEMLMLMPEEKMYMVMPIKQPVQKAMEKQTGTNQEVESTGKSETILGYKCDQIIAKDKEKGTVTELWVASGLGVFMGLGNSGGGGGMFGGHKSASSEKWEEALKGKGGFPMRVITRDAKGTETFKMEATKIEPGAQPDALFVPPADYQKFQMPDMGSMMNQFK